MDQSAQGQGCQGTFNHPLITAIRANKLFQLSIAEERDRRRAVALAAHS